MIICIINSNQDIDMQSKIDSLYKLTINLRHCVRCNGWIIVPKLIQYQRK